MKLDDDDDDISRAIGATHRRADGRRRILMGWRSRRRVRYDRSAARRTFGVQTAVGAVRRIAMLVVGDECVGVGRGAGRHYALLLGRRGGRFPLAIIVAQVVALQRLGERQLLRMTNS